MSRPVRLVHLGLGNFFRAHQAWFTDQAPDAQEWGIAAFSGRSAELARRLEAQGGQYTLVTRGPDADRFDVVRSVVAAHPASDDEAWLRYLASPSVTAVTMTVTEAGYRADAPSSAPARLLAGLSARMRADAGPLALVPCDNLPDNGTVLRRALLDRADPALAAWIEAHVVTVTTVVDRITPRTAAEDVAAVRSAGFDDAVPVVTEPFAEWVLSGDLPAARPRWDGAGARIVDDVTPYEQRKLWLLNGAHSLMAYAGSLRGHATIAEAVADDALRGWVEEWWDDAAPHVAVDVADYRAALLDRWGNRRMRHLLRQIAMDGSQKLPVRILPVLRHERAAGRLPAGAVRVLASWVAWVRSGAEVEDVRAGEIRAARSDADLLGLLDPELADDVALVAAVAGVADQAGWKRISDS